MRMAVVAFRTAQTAGDMVVRLEERGFVWCLLHTGEIDEMISSASNSISDAFQRFNVSFQS